jgi:acyl-CoA dehydrogenase
MTEPLQALRAGVPDPALESAALGEWLLAAGGLERAGGLVAVAPSVDVRLEGERLTGTARHVPWARRAAGISLVLDDGRVCHVSRSDSRISEGSDLAGDERDDVEWDAAPVGLGDRIEPDALLQRGALVRAVLMAGALERISAMAITYANERVQFGRPIASFQAVQAHLVTIAQQAALVSIATDAGLIRTEPFQIAIAKLLANRAAVIAGRAAHQVHGARGVTLEHELPQYTRRLWAWRSEYGGERFWSGRLGADAVARGAEDLYPTIAR